jgi:hypothetical protein
VGGGRDTVAEDCVEFVFLAPQEPRQRSVGGFFSPLAEQMEDEEQRRRLRSVGRIERQIRIDLVEEGGNHLGALRRCRL